MAKKKKRKNQPIGKNLRKHVVRLVDDAFGIVAAVGNPQRMYKVIRKTVKKRPALSAVGAIAAAAAIYAQQQQQLRADEHSGRIGEAEAPTAVM